VIAPYELDVLEAGMRIASIAGMTWPRCVSGALIGALTGERPTTDTEGQT